MATITYVPGKLYRSRDFDLIKPNYANRKIDELRVGRLAVTMQEVGFLPEYPIIVDKKMIIKAGGHRYETAKRLKIAFYFMITEGYSMENMRIAETTGNTAWKPDDFARHFAVFKGANNAQYLIFEEFRREFPKIPAAIAMHVLAGRSKRDYKVEKHFKDGTFTIGNRTKAWDTGGLIYKLSTLYKGSFRRSFILAILDALAVPGFEIPKLERKLKYRNIKDAPNKEDYVNQIEEIYNFREVKKLNLRFHE